MAKIIAVDLDAFEKEFKQIINGYKAQHWVIKPEEVEQIIERCMESAMIPCTVKAGLPVNPEFKDRIDSIFLSTFPLQNQD